MGRVGATHARHQLGARREREAARLGRRAHDAGLGENRADDDPGDQVPHEERRIEGRRRAIVLVRAEAHLAWLMEGARERGRQPVGVIEAAARGAALGEAEEIEVTVARFVCAGLSEPAAQPGVEAKGSTAPIAGVAVVVWDASWVDPAASILIAGLVLWAAWGLLADTAQVLLEGTPLGIEPEEISRAITAQPGIDGLHHLHVWSLASDTPALSAHLVVEGEITMHEAQQRGEAVRTVLERDFGIAHATLELECHPCAPETEDGHSHR